jgi:hypothetical protein
MPNLLWDREVSGKSFVGTISLSIARFTITARRIPEQSPLIGSQIAKTGCRGTCQHEKEQT